MKQEIVTIEISKKTGMVKFDCSGFQGEGCNVIEQIEQSVGTVAATSDKDERYQYELSNPVPINISI